MKRTLTALGALLACAALAASLEVGRVGAQGAPVSLPPATWALLASTSPVGIKSGSGVFYGASNIGNAAQSNVINCYDAVSATSSPIASAVLPTPGAAIPGIPAGGVQFRNGLTCQVPTAIVTPGVIVYYR